MPRIRRMSAKQLDTVLATRNGIETSESVYMPRSRTERTDGVIMAVPTETGERISDVGDEMMNTKLTPSWRHSAAVDWLASTTRRHQHTPTDCTATRLLHSVCRNRIISACRRRNHAVVECRPRLSFLRITSPPCKKEPRSDQETIVVAPQFDTS